MSGFYQLMMRNKGGGAKILNLESVNGATLDENFVFYNDSNQSYMYNKYFKTKVPIDLRNNNDILFKIKFKITGNQSGIFCADNSQASWYTFLSSYVNSSGALWVSIDANYRNPPTLQLNTYYYLKISRSRSDYNYKVEYSLDDINYTLIDNYHIVGTIPAMYMFFGSGASTGSNYGLIGYIDFKETDIIINGKSVLWVDNPSILLTVVGSLTITDDVVSGFDSSNYLTANNILSTTVGNKYVFEGEVSLSSISSTQYIFSFFCNSQTNSTVFGFAFRGTGKFMVVTTDGTNPSITEGTLSYQTDTTYKYKVETDLNTYVRVYINGNLDISISLSYTNIRAYDGTVYYGCFAFNKTLPLATGLMNFGNSYIVNNGTRYKLILPQ